MILAWNDDRAQNRAPVTYSDAPVLTEENTPSGTLPQTDTNSGLEPATPAATTGAQSADQSGSTLEVPAPVQQQAPVVTQVERGADEGRLIKVTTPKLIAWIDLLGGDIVRVQLPGYAVSMEQPDVPYQLLERGSGRLYIAQSGLIGPDGPDAKERARYVASSTQFEILEGTREIVLNQVGGEGAEVKKVFTFRADDHLVDVRYELTNLSDRPLHAQIMAQIRRDSRPPTTDESFALAPQPFLGAAITTPEERYFKADFEDVDEEPTDITVQGGWVAFLQHYFLSAWVAQPEEMNRFLLRRASDGNYLFGYTGQLKEVPVNGVGEWNAQFYAGPKDQKRLEEIAPNLNLTIDYGFLWWLAIPLFLLLDWLHGLVGNWGIAIILLTVCVKAVLYPLSAAGYKSMANMRRVAPAMKRLQERYANDREKLSREMMDLYKKEGANPLGGCLPMLLPMPIFIALYWVLFESVELRHAPFMLWIDDLSQMDPLFILPLLMGASTYWMQSLNPQVGDPMQQRMMKMMPIMFTVLFLFFPAGLVLYWLVNNVLSIAQQQYVYKQAEKAQAAK